MEPRPPNKIAIGIIVGVVMLAFGYSAWSWRSGAPSWPLWLLLLIGVAALVVSTIRGWGWFRGLIVIGITVALMVAVLYGQSCFIGPVCGNDAAVAVGGLFVTMVLNTIDQFVLKRRKRDD